MAASDSGFADRSRFLVSLAAFWVNLCLMGVLRSNAVVYSALVDVLGIQRQHAAWPAGVLGFFMSVTGAVSGILTNYWSIRSLALSGVIIAAISVSVSSLAFQIEYIIIFYGVFQGIGIGLIVPLTHVVINRNFSKYRACAMGIAYSGSSVGSFLLPPLSSHLLHSYGLQGTFLILGGIMLNALLGAMFFRTPRVLLHRKDCGESDQELSGSDLKEGSCCGKRPAVTVFDNAKRNDSFFFVSTEILSSPMFLITSLAYATCFSSSRIFLMVVIDFCTDRGLPESNGLYLISAYSLGDLAGRLLSGWIADLQLIRRSTLVRLYLIVMGSLLVMLPYGGMTVAAAAMGVASGGLTVNFSALLSEYLGLQKLPMTMGFATCIVGMSAFLRPVVIGYFRDYHKSYGAMFIFLGLLQVSMSAIWFLELIIPWMNQTLFRSQNLQ